MDLGINYIDTAPAYGASEERIGQFLEVYVNAPIEVCEQRDPKGLYVKARANLIKDFTGVSAPYEAPEQPEMELHTDKLSASESVARILDYLQFQDKETIISI